MASQHVWIAGGLVAMLGGAAVSAAEIHPAHGPSFVGPPPSAYREADRLVEFWRQAGPAMWFAKDPAFDHDFRRTFAELHRRAAAGQLDEWVHAPNSALALVILLDQYPRNAFRGTARMYATDDHARRIAAAAILAGHDRVIDQQLALFMYLPFGHSESLIDQERSVELTRRLGENELKHALGHRDIIHRFGRFPHRNPILGREMRLEEQAYLDNGGFRG